MSMFCGHSLCEHLGISCEHLSFEHMSCEHIMVTRPNGSVPDTHQPNV